MENDNRSSAESTPQAPVQQRGLTRSKSLIIGVLLLAPILAYGTKDYVTKYLNGITVTDQIAAEYEPISNPHAPSFIALKGQLEREGIKPDDSELSMFSFSEAAFQYRWLRGNESRVYVVRMNSHGLWDIYPQ
jgi:hypothetical protein